MSQRKLAQLQKKYGFDIDEELIDRRRDGEGLRGLEEFVNRKIADTVASGTTVSSDQLYRVITEDVTEQERATVETRLADFDINLSDVKEDFISYEGVRTYLNNDLNIKPEKENLSVADALRIIDWSGSRHKGIVENQLERLAQSHDKFSLGCDGINVHVNVSVTCRNTGETYRIREFIDNDGCST